MLPIRDDVLQLEMIAEYWSREIAGARTRAEIHEELLCALWQNELRVFGSRGETPVDRRRLLESVRLKSEHPGFTVVDCIEMIPPGSEEHSDGSITVDVTTYVVLPSDETHWTDDIVESAYRTLAAMSFEDFHDLLKPGLRALSTTREVIAAYCESMGYGLPRFWFGTKQRGKWTIRNQRDVEVWLKQIASGPKLKPKKAYFVEAGNKFPGIPGKAFDRIWDKTVSESWKRSGPVVRAPHFRTDS
jgi:hypothetical protein